VAKVLQLHHLRRLFSRAQLASPPGGAAPAPPAAAAGPAAQDQQAQPHAGPVAEAGAGAAGAAIAAAFQRARAAVGLGGDWQALLPPPPPATSAYSAMQAARSAARRLRRQRIVLLPKWVLMPSELQQHWIRYSLLSIGAGYVSLFVYRCAVACWPALPRRGCCRSCAGVDAVVAAVVFGLSSASLLLKCKGNQGYSGSIAH
jgi:hypothetical protein